MKQLLTIIAAIVAITATAQADDNKPTYSKAFVSAKLLYKKYDANPIAADAKYRYTSNTVTGIVEDIGRDILGNPYIVLKGQDNEFGIGGVQCTFSTEAEAEIAKVSKGQLIAIYGEIKGLVFFNVQVSDCEFTDIPVKITKAIAVK